MSWKTRQEKVLKSFKNPDEIIREVSDFLGPTLSPKDWFIQDHLFGTRIFLISQKPKYRYRIVGGVPYTERVGKVPEWDGVIIDLDNPEFRISDYYRGEKLVVRKPLSYTDDDKIEVIEIGKEVDDEDVLDEEGIDEAFTPGKSYEETLHVISGEVKIISFVDVPIVRLWKDYHGTVHLSSSERIDCNDYVRPGISPILKSYGEVYQNLAGPRDEAFNGINDRCVYFFQMITPEMRSTTSHWLNPGLLLLEVANSIGGETHPPTFITVIPSPIPTQQANEWMGLFHEEVMDDRMTGGDSIIVTNGNERFYLVPYSQEWRRTALGEETSFYHRFQQIMNARFLSQEDFAKIWPVIGPIESVLERQLTMMNLFIYILPANLRPFTQGLFEKYWGPDGLIHQLADFIIERKEASENGKTKLLNAEVDTLLHANSYQGTLRERLMQVIFQTDPSRAHLDGDALHIITKKMESIRKMIRKASERSNSN